MNHKHFHFRPMDERRDIANKIREKYKRDPMQKTKKILLFFGALLFLGCNIAAFSVESSTYRLLSISESEKLILVSRIPDKRKYLLDASSAKITLNGKSTELKELGQFSIVQVKLQLGKKKKNAIELDGTAIEIMISNPDK